MGWDATRHLDKGPIEERRPDFETTSHAGSVHRHQVLAGEIELAVLIDQAINRGQPRRLADGQSQLVEGLTLDARRAHALREEGRPLRRSEPPQQELGANLWRKRKTSEELLQEKLDAAVPRRGCQTTHRASRRVLHPQW